MTETQIAAVAVVLSILTATWKMSSLIGGLSRSFETLTRTVDKLSDKLDGHNNLIVKHDEQIKNLDRRMDDAA